MNAVAVIIGALLLIWPAFVNGYPLVFSDTAALANMAMEPTIGWDKPWVYGPFLLATDWRVSLWGPVIAQGLIVSAVLWQVFALLGGNPRNRPARHLALCLLLAVGSTAPWFTALLMPDVFTPLVVLCVFLLAYAPFSLRIAVVGAVAVAVHLAHLVLAAACIAVVLLLRPRRVLVCAIPLAAALGVLLATNYIGNGVVAISPFGSVFALARLQADGPAADYLHAACPAAAPHFCGWAAQLPMDSDAFLWGPDGPIWANQSGPTRVAAEAAHVVAATVAGYPREVAAAALRNTVRQLAMVRVGDALVPDYLKDTVGLLLSTYFPPFETRWFDASRQVAGTLPALAAPLVPLQLTLMVLGAAGTLATIVVAWRRRDGALAGFALLVLVGVAANAAATGALSGPHGRYQARIAWLLLLPPLAAVTRLRPPLPAGAAAPALHNRPPASR